MRPKRLTSEQIRELVWLIENGKTQKEQAAHLGMHMATLAQRIKDQLAVQLAVEDVGKRMRASIRPGPIATPAAMSSDVSPTDRACVHLSWLVGILEGEGCFSWMTQSSGNVERGPHAQGATRRTQFRPYYGSPNVTLVMTDEDVVRRAGRVAEVLGCGPALIHVRKPKKNWKMAWVAKWNGPAAIMLMSLVESLMGARRRARIRDILAKLATEPSERASGQHEPARYASPSLRRRRALRQSNQSVRSESES